MTSFSEVILEGTLDPILSRNINPLTTKEKTALASAQFVLPFTKKS